MLGGVAVGSVAVCAFVIGVLVHKGPAEAALWAGVVGGLAGVVGAAAAVCAVVRPPSGLPPPPELEVPDWVVGRPAELAEGRTQLAERATALLLFLLHGPATVADGTGIATATTTLAPKAGLLSRISLSGWQLAAAYAALFVVLFGAVTGALVAEYGNSAHTTESSQSGAPSATAAAGPGTAAASASPAGRAAYSPVDFSPQANFTWVGPERDPDGAKGTYFPHGPRGFGDSRWHTVQHPVERCRLPGVERL